ncbi:MAG: glycosyltransferase [Paracoccus sp. (in: a-proteobacteria)]|uniref:glycosyltransferase n=1 Tax=Paracoccus sp. TaxID=267 RepID=UPI0026DEB499|nr:glycosyltransferase [Paracoccus sp. (in: a-proteobacteria)]MDO5622711.1 glycosyltransferase [Paracoccus sp. (in: a-proteobacteria)]
MQHAHWQLRVLGRIVRTAVTQGPAVAINLLRRRNIDRDTLRQQLGLASAPSAPTLLDNSLFTRRVLPPVPPDTAITVVLPVYNAFELLQESLHRIEAYTDLPWHLIAVEDCSPDNRVRSWLRDWTATRSDHVTLLENEQNLGFIGSVNRAFQVAPKDRPLVLLNSDALVPEGWASRIVAPILADPGIASVTPMSNDATIFSLPVIGLSSGIPNGLADRLDRTARGLSDALTAPAPTGVGFCMAMSGRALATVGQFDTVFGKGYGEEVDWCQRILRDHGLRHVGIGNLFVEHRGGQSFGSEAKMALIRANGRLISTRYPAFDQDVQDYIAADPLRGHRIALALDWAAGMATDQGARLPVYVAHSMGGGAESWLRGTLAADLDSTLPAAVVIRLGNATRYLVELHTKGSVSRVAVNDTAVLRRLLAPVAGNRLIYSCGVGDPYGIEIPGLIRDLAGPEGRIEVLVHDYWPVSPSYTLVDADGIFHGVPALDSYDSAHQGIDAAGRKVTLADWQAEWGRLILAANEVRVFSNSSARIIRQVWPALGDTLVVRGHQTDTQGLAIADPDWLDDTPGTIAVLGAIGAYKGALYLSQVAAAFQKLPDAPRLVVIGEFDLSFPLPASVTVTGRYHPEDLPGLIRQHRVQAWLMPSIVPETFSFATHEMLATGLPVMSFDLGAQGDTVAAAPNGHILPDRTAPTLLRLFRQITGKAG